ncbi:MAG: flippase [Ignavibacterium sp.]
MTDRNSLKTIAKNASFNFFGSLIPLLIALSTIPIIISKLGTDKFGVLNLSWIVIGYFGFFDLGIGRALTKIIAEKIGLSQSSEIPAYFWTSFLLVFVFSSILAICLYFFSEKIILNFFKIPVEIQIETVRSFNLLILAIPIVSTSAGIRGLLEAYQRFDIINVIRTFLGALSFLIPVLVLMFTTNLYWIIFFLVLTRLLFWLIFLISSFYVNPEIFFKLRINKNLIKPIFRLSSWMTLSNITVPVITYSDRILVASLISATALTYYATPYEIITKMLIIPSALTAVLFPTFAANYLNDPSSAVTLSDKAMKYLAIILFPIISIILVFSYDFLKIWLGEDFALNSYQILQLLSIGIFFNSLAFIPFSFIEGIGRPDVTAKIQLIELPIYILLLWFTIRMGGIYGASIAFFARMFIDFLILVYFSKKVAGLKFRFNFNKRTIYLLSFIIFLSLIVYIPFIILKILFLSLFMVFFLTYAWKYLLDVSDKYYIKSLLKFNR